MLSGSLGCLLLGWSWTGHEIITKVAVEVFAATISGRLLTRLGVRRDDLREHLSGLWLQNCCEDLTIANAAGLCSVEIVGGQIAHFMRDLHEDQRLAYRSSVLRIRKACVRARRGFREAFPQAQDRTFGDDLRLGLGRFLSAIREGAGLSVWYRGVNDLSMALHTLQDSYSPAHTKREDGTFVIRGIYRWDDANKHPNPHAEPPWPGHKAYDDPEHNSYTTDLDYQATRATRHLLRVIFENLHETDDDFMDALEGFCQRRLNAQW
jgi:hypothetical protein